MISIDLETSCNGQAEYRTWRDGFKIDSLACSWRTETGEIQSWFSDDPKQVDKMIRRLAETQKPLVVHNLSFEMAAFMKLYPELEFNWYADTMRLAQLDDNAAGTDWRDHVFKTADDILDELLEEEDTWKPGLSLEACASRYLPAEYHNHKAKAYKWLEDNHGIKTKHGSHLHLLPYDVLKEYNEADTEITLRLAEELIETFKLQGYDWQQDWVLYTTRCRLMKSAYLRGLKIDRVKLREHIYAVSAEIESIKDEFFAKTVDAREEWARKHPGKRKTKPVKPEDFNIGSTTQLAQLFIKGLGIVGGRTTKTGQTKIDSGELTKEKAAIDYPSFASKHLHLWGPLGDILYRRKKRLLVLQQMLGVLLGSEETGRLYCDVRVSGTATGRVAGGTGIN